MHEINPNLILQIQIVQLKTMFVPREHDTAFIVVFDAAGDSSRITWLIWFAKPTRDYTQYSLPESIRQ